MWSWSRASGASWRKRRRTCCRNRRAGAAPLGPPARACPTATRFAWSGFGPAAAPRFFSTARKGPGFFSGTPVIHRFSRGLSGAGSAAGFRAARVVHDLSTVSTALFHRPGRAQCARPRPVAPRGVTRRLNRDVFPLARKALRRFPTENPGKTRNSLTGVAALRILGAKVVSDLSGADPGFAGRRKNPRRGGGLCGDPQGPPRSRLRRAGEGRRFAADPIQAQGRRFPRRGEPSRREIHPWRGRKPKGGTGRPRRSSPVRQRTSAEGKARKAGEDPGRTEPGAVRADVRRADPAVRRGSCRGRGNLRRAQSQERYRSETGSERLREEQGVKRVRNPGGAAYPGGQTRGSRFPLPQAL